jgi:hypothetical protein
MRLRQNIVDVLAGASVGDDAADDWNLLIRLAYFAGDGRSAGHDTKDGGKKR